MSLDQGVERIHRRRHLGSIKVQIDLSFEIDCMNVIYEGMALATFDSKGEFAVDEDHRVTLIHGLQHLHVLSFAYPNKYPAHFCPIFIKATKAQTIS